MWLQKYIKISAGFTYMYRLDRLKPRASKFRGPSAKVYNIFNAVIWISHLCCHNVLYFLNNPSVIFLTQLHSISELQNFKHPSSSSPLLKLIKHTSIFLPHKWNSLGSRASLYLNLALIKIHSYKTVHTRHVIQDRRLLNTAWFNKKWINCEGKLN